MFQRFPVHPAKLLLRVYHCCWEQDSMSPVITLSPINPPLASPQLVFVSSTLSLIFMRRKAAPCETPHCSMSPEGRDMDMFSMDRQKFVVRFPLLSVVLTVRYPFVIEVAVGSSPRPASDS